MKKTTSLMLVLALMLSLFSTALPFSVSAADTAESKWLLNPNTGAFYSGYVLDDTHVLNGEKAAKRTIRTSFRADEVVFNPVDISDYSDGYLHILIYVDNNADKFDSTAYMEISSGGANNVEEMMYDFAGKLSNGWNNITIKLSTGVARGGAIDYSAVDWSRFVIANSYGNVDIWIDGIYVSKTENGGAPGTATPEEGAAAQWMLNPNSTAFYANYGLDSTHVLNGKKAGKCTTSATLRTDEVSFGPVDISEFSNGYLHILIYVEKNAPSMNVAYMEMSSGGANNVEEMNYDFSGKLQNGWNTLTFKLSEGTPRGGAIRYNNINWSRMVFQNNGGGTDIWVDGIYVSKNADDDAPAVPSSVPEYDKNFSPVLRFAVLSDVHVAKDGSGVAKLQNAIAKAYEFAESNSNHTTLDAIVFPGDLTGDGSAADYNVLMQTLESSVQTGTQIIACTGNHDELEGSIGQAGFSEYFKVDPDNVTYINGIPFIALSAGVGNFSNEEVAWLQAQLEEANETGKPIFVMQHYPFANTTAGTYGAVNPAEMQYGYEVLSQYSQVIDFSGHQHYPLNDPKAIYQDDFTLVNSGALLYTKYDGYTPTDASASAQGLIVEVNAENTVRIFPYDFKENKLLYGGEPWVIEDPFDPSTFAYTSARDEASVPPAFKETDAVTVSDIGENSAKITFPTITEGDVVKYYRVNIYKKDSSYLVRSTTVHAQFHRYNPETQLSARIALLNDGTDYRIEVVAENAFGKLSEPLVGYFTTVDFEGDSRPPISSFSIDSNGNAVVENGLSVYGFGNNAQTALVQKNGRYGVISTNGYKTYIDIDTSKFDIVSDTYRIKMTYFDTIATTLYFNYLQFSTNSNVAYPIYTSGSNTWQTIEFYLTDIDLSMQHQFNVFPYSFTAGDFILGDLEVEKVEPSTAPTKNITWVADFSENSKDMWITDIWQGYIKQFQYQSELKDSTLITTSNVSSDGRSATFYGNQHYSFVATKVTVDLSKYNTLYIKGTRSNAQEYWFGACATAPWESDLIPVIAKMADKTLVEGGTTIDLSGLGTGMTSFWVFIGLFQLAGSSFDLDSLYIGTEDATETELDSFCAGRETIPVLGKKLRAEYATADTQALCFGVQINRFIEDGKQFVNYAGETYELKEFGTLLMTTEKVSRLTNGINDLCKDNLPNGALDCVGNNIWEQDDEKLVYTAVLTDIPADQVSTPITVRPYMLLEDANGNTSYVYGNAYSGSVAATMTALS